MKDKQVRSQPRRPRISIVRSSLIPHPSSLSLLQPQLHGIAKLRLPDIGHFVYHPTSPITEEGLAVDITLQELADLVRGTVYGDGSLPIRAARSLQEAAEGDITYVDNERFLDKLHASSASAAVVDLKVVPNGKPLLQVKDPLAAFVTIVQHLHGRPEPAACGIDPRACVHASAKVGNDPSVYPMAYVGEETVIGDRCRIHPNVVIGRNCKLGNDVTLFANAVLYEEGTLEIGDRSIIHSASAGDRGRRLRLSASRRPARQGAAARQRHHQVRMSRSGRARRSTAAPSRRRGSATAPRSTTSSRSATTAAGSARHNIFARANREWPALAPPATTSSWPARSASRTTSTSAWARSSAPSPASTRTCRPAYACSAAPRRSPSPS